MDNRPNHSANANGEPRFTEEQQSYLQGFFAGGDLGRSMRSLPTFAATLGLQSGHLPGSGAPDGANAAPGGAVPTGPEAVHFLAQDRQVAEGKKLVPEEVAKRKRFPLDVWDDIRQHAAENRYPTGADVLAFKYHGLFYVAPAQDSYMLRLRFAGGLLPAFKARAVADVAERYGGGYADCTTRANLQIRDVQAKDADAVLMALQDAGVVIRGSGADNIRNVTGSPLAGIDPHEVHDTRDLARAMHHYVMHRREMYGLPRKFNIAFDGGGSVSAVEDTNDVGFGARRVGEGRADDEGRPVEPGVYYRLQLGGITGHKDFARDTGVLLRPDECVPVAAAVVRVFIDHGDRSDRRKARLKYLLDRWGLDRYLAETERALGRRLRRLPLAQCEPPAAVAKHGHLGVHPQKQAGLFYVGVVLPVGRMTSAQLRGLADVADRHGADVLRLTVWQNVLITDVPGPKLDQVKREIEALGLHWDANHVRGGLIACTGAAGCKFAMTHTKRHALAVAEHVEARGPVLDTPVNIHLTGCPNSCAQHYMGDVGMLGTKVVVNEGAADEAEVEGYHVFVGGGYGAEQMIGRELYRSVAATDLPRLIERMLRGYLAGRRDAGETFNEFVRRHETEALKAIFDAQARAAADEPRTTRSVQAASATPPRRMVEPLAHAD